MPCMSPIGYQADKMGVKEVLMRKGVKADTRFDFSELFFKGDFNTPLTQDEAKECGILLALEAVRLAPSAVNKQPWRIIIDNNLIYFYKKPLIKNNRAFDVEKVDLGIAMNHFVQGLKNKGLEYEFNISNPNIESNDCEYIATIIIK
jgi:hypothetical protein